MSLFETPPATPGVDETTDYLSQLVGEDKKFKDVAGLARGKAESDAFIARLQGELSGLRDELNKRDRLGELIDKLTPKEQPPVQQHQEEPSPGLGSEAFDPAKLAELVEKTIAARETRSTADRNLDSVKSALAEKWGPSYGDKLRQKASELGVSTDWLQSAAQTSPNAFYNLIGLTPSAQSAPGFSPPPSQGRASFEPANPTRNNAYYENLRKADSSKYWSPAIQNQLHKDALALGEKFFAN